MFFQIPSWIWSFCFFNISCMNERVHTIMTRGQLNWIHYGSLVTSKQAIEQNLYERKLITEKGRISKSGGNREAKTMRYNIIEIPFTPKKLIDIFILQLYLKRAILQILFFRINCKYWNWDDTLQSYHIRIFPNICCFYISVLVHANISYILSFYYTVEPFLIHLAWHDIPINIGISTSNLLDFSHITWRTFNTRATSFSWSSLSEILPGLQQWTWTRAGVDANIKSP